MSFRGFTVQAVTTRPGTRQIKDRVETESADVQLGGGSFRLKAPNGEVLEVALSSAVLSGTWHFEENPNIPVRIEVKTLRINGKARESSLVRLFGSSVMFSNAVQISNAGTFQWSSEATAGQLQIKSSGVTLSEANTTLNGAALDFGKLAGAGLFALTLETPTLSVSSATGTLSGKWAEASSVTLAVGDLSLRGSHLQAKSVRLKLQGQTGDLELGTVSLSDVEATAGAQPLLAPPAIVIPSLKAAFGGNSFSHATLSSWEPPLLVPQGAAVVDAVNADGDTQVRIAVPGATLSTMSIKDLKTLYSQLQEAEVTSSVVGFGLDEENGRLGLSVLGSGTASTGGAVLEIKGDAARATDLAWEILLLPLQNASSPYYALVAATALRPEMGRPTSWMPVALADCGEKGKTRLVLVPPRTADAIKRIIPTRRKPLGREPGLPVQLKGCLVSSTVVEIFTWTMQKLEGRFK